MTRDEILRRLADSAATIRQRFGVRSLALFGSMARGEARPDSDVDLMVEFEDRPTFDGFMGLKAFLEELLLCRVDLVTRTGLRPRLRERIDRECVRVA